MKGCVNAEVVKSQFCRRMAVKLWFTNGWAFGTVSGAFLRNCHLQMRLPVHHRSGELGEKECFPQWKDCTASPLERQRSYLIRSLYLCYTSVFSQGVRCTLRCGEKMGDKPGVKFT